MSTLLPDLPRRRLYLCKLLSAAAFLCILFFIGSSFVTFDYKQKVSKWEPTMAILQNIKHSSCKIQGKPSGSEPLPKGIIRRTSNLEMQPLWGSLPSPKQKGHKSPSKSLLAIAVGVKQKEVVNQIVKKFSSSDFIVMLFHYDGIVNKWRDLSWSDKALHISAMNQTKWWFAKRFLHPDIVAEYDYIFLWDEDLNVENFNPSRYLSIVRREGLDISQPGLDTSKSNVHHRITARRRKGDVHRWVEMMAPVFSRAAWRCAWHMIQGDRSKKVGVVDSEYIGHLGLPTLGGLNESKKSTETSSDYSQSKASRARKVRKRSYVELEIFKERWQRAVADDKCWIDPYPVPEKEADR